MTNKRPKLMNGHFQCQDKLTSIFYLQATETWTFAENKDKILSLVNCKSASAISTVCFIIVLYLQPLAILSDVSVLCKFFIIFR